MKKFIFVAISIAFWFFVIGLSACLTSCYTTIKAEKLDFRGSIVRPLDVDSI